jgi:hypothetical protein
MRVFIFQQTLMLILFLESIDIFHRGTPFKSILLHELSISKITLAHLPFLHAVSNCKHVWLWSIKIISLSIYNFAHTKRRGAYVKVRQNRDRRARPSDRCHSRQNLIAADDRGASWVSDLWGQLERRWWVRGARSLVNSLLLIPLPFDSYLSRQKKASRFSLFSRYEFHLSQCLRSAEKERNLPVRVIGHSVKSSKIYGD